jgi:hypothetical protein
MTAASRRSVLTALAAVPAAGVPALADVAGTSEPDPVFALIDAAKQANARLHEELRYSGELDEQRCANLELSAKAAWEAEDAALAAKPRTLAGLAEQLIFAAEFLAEQTCLCEDGPWFDEATVILPLLMNAARMVDGSFASKIALSERLAKIMSFVDQENEPWRHNS